MSILSRKQPNTANPQMNTDTTHHNDGTMTLHIMSGSKLPLTSEEVYALPIATRAQRKRKLEEYTALLRRDKEKYEESSDRFSALASCDYEYFNKRNERVDWNAAKVMSDLYFEWASDDHWELQEILKSLKAAERLLANWL
jgi:hypothetical protein